MSKTKTPQSKSKPEVVVIESQVMMTDLNMYKDRFQELPQGMYKVQYVCPYYVLNMVVSWDGEQII